MAEPQISRKKTTLWNLFYLYINNIIGIVRGILIIPLYLAFIDIELYGAWLATGNILMWLTLFDPGVGDVAIQKIAFTYAKTENKDLKYQISSSIILSLIIAIIAGFAGWTLSFFLDQIVTIPNSVDKVNLVTAFNIGMVSTAITLFSFAFSGTLIGLQRTKQIGLVRNITAVVGILINVFFLFHGYRLISIALGGFITALLAIIVYALLLVNIMRKEQINFGFSFKYFKEYNKIFTFTFLSKLFGTIAQNIDLILVSRFIGLQEVTILELTRRPIKVISGLINSPSIALLPTISNLYGEGNSEKLTRIISKTLKLFLFVLIFICGGIIAFNEKLINIWVGKEFYVGDLLNNILAFSFLSAAFGYIVSNMTFSLGKIKTNSIFEIIKNVFSLILLVLLGKFFGLWGIVSAALISSMFSELWFYPYLLNKTIKINHKELLLSVKQLSTFFLITIIFSMIINYINFNEMILNISIFFLYILFSIALVFILARDTKELVIHFIKYRKFNLN